MTHAPWIGVDFDGTLAVYGPAERCGPDTLGAPIPEMVLRVKEWLAQGFEVRIFTARVGAADNNPAQQNYSARATIALQAWSQEHIGQVLPLTCSKDFNMLEFWDDRAVRVEFNTGRRIG